jgi:hypothetical protein
VTVSHYTDGYLLLRGVLDERDVGVVRSRLLELLHREWGIIDVDRGGLDEV